MTKFTRTLLMVEATRIDYLHPNDFDAQAKFLESATGYSFNRLSRTRSKRVMRASCIGKRVADLSRRA